MKDFKMVGGVEIENLGEYLRNYYAKNPKIKFYVGTDSLQNGKFTKYVTTVCMQHPEHTDNTGHFHRGAGVHLVFKRNNVKRIRDVFTRLWHETELTIETALYVDEALKNVWKQPLNNERVPIVHLDFNESPKFKSHQVSDASMGWLRGEGFEVYCKPFAWASSYGADWLCR